MKRPRDWKHERLLKRIVHEARTGGRPFVPAPPGSGVKPRGICGRTMHPARRHPPQAAACTPLRNARGATVRECPVCSPGAKNQ
jgi:hypothetical protein